MRSKKPREERWLEPNLLFQRATYDQHGPDGPPKGGMGPDMDMDDLFASMFGGGMGFDPFTDGGGFSFDPSGGPSHGRRPKPSRGRDTTVAYDITLEEAFKGKKVVMSLERDRVCGGCKGSGARNGVTPGDCGKCEGKGFILTDRHVSGHPYILKKKTKRGIPRHLSMVLTYSAPLVARPRSPGEDEDNMSRLRWRR